MRVNNYFSTPPVVQNLLIINVLAFLATTLLPVDVVNKIYNYGALFPVQTHPFYGSMFKIYQLVTYMFLHGGFTHMFFNMFALWMFGRILEQHLGAKRFLIYYMACGIGAGVIQLIVNYLGGVYAPTVGASGAIFGLLLAFGMLYPNSVIMLIFPPIPIKAKYFVIVYGFIELWLGVRGVDGDNIAHFAHLGGMLWGFLLLWYWKKEGKIYY